MSRYLPYMDKVSNLNELNPAAFVDLGDQGCGDLVMDLLKAIRPLKPGEILKVRALDPAAPIDIAAWCAMRNHELLAGPCGENNAFYYIKKGE